jgi:hypothetical protein
VTALSSTPQQSIRPQRCHCRVTRDPPILQFSSSSCTNEVIYRGGRREPRRGHAARPSVTPSGLCGSISFATVGERRQAAASRCPKSDFRTSGLRIFQMTASVK